MPEFAKIEKPITNDVYAYRGAVGPGPGGASEQGRYDLAESFRDDTTVAESATGWTYDTHYKRWVIAMTPGATKDIAITLPGEVPTATKVQFRVSIPVFTAGSILLRYNSITLKTWVPADVVNGLLTFDYTTLVARSTFTLRVPADAAVAAQVAAVAVRIGTNARKTWRAANTGALDAAVPVRVPLVVGMLDTAATDLLEDLGFVVTPSTATHATVPEDHVISQTPAGKVLADEGDGVAIVVSLGPA